MKIRPIKRRDLPQCAEAFVEVFGGPPWHEDWDVQGALTRLEELHDTPGFYGVAAHEGTEIIGFAMGHTERWLRTRHFYLMEMCVQAQHQRQGVGTGVMETLCRDLAEMGVEAIYLLTARDGMAEAFYRKCGFYVNSKMIMMGRRLKEGD